MKPAFFQKKSLTQVFSCEFCEFFINKFWLRRPPLYRYLLKQNSGKSCEICLFLLLTLNMFNTFSWYFYCSLWTSNSLLGFSCNYCHTSGVVFILTVSRRRPLSYKNQSIDLLCKSVLLLCLMENSFMKVLTWNTFRITI